MIGYPPSVEYAATAPFLVTVGLDPTSFTRLDALRIRYFPPERNFIPAHISLFHHLPPEESQAIHEALAHLAASTGPIPLRFSSLFRLGGGFAFRIESDPLTALHTQLAGTFKHWLTPQDRQPFKPHVTIMNKANRDEAARSLAEMQPTWSPWDGQGEALLLWHYLGGPWNLAARYPFTKNITIT